MDVNGVSRPNSGISQIPLDSPGTASEAGPAAATHAENKGDSYRLVVKEGLLPYSGARPFTSLIWSTNSADIPSPPTEDLA